MELWLLAFLQIMLINIILSGDNAMVIAMASRNLPAPKQKIAIFWGASGAILLRIVLTFVALHLLQVPYLMTVGALLLIWVAIKLLVEQQDHNSIQAAQKLGMVVMTIVMADFIMSLDNVIAIAAIAEGDLLLIVLGLSLSIPIIVWGSGFILNLINRFPIVIYIGAGILAFTAGEMIMKDERVSEILQASFSFPSYVFASIVALAVIFIGLNKKNNL